MSPHRRSQGDISPAIVLLLIKRASKCKPKLTTRARDAESLNKANNELNIEPNADEKRKKKTSIFIRKPSTKKDLLPNIRIRSTVDVVALSTILLASFKRLC